MKRIETAVLGLVMAAAVVLPATAHAASRDAVGPVAPGVVAEAAQSEPSDPAAAETGVVNVNTATLQQLVLLPGVGPARAQAIIAHRDQHPFRRVEELLQIRGIGRATLERLRPYVAVDGQTTLTRPVAGGGGGRRRH